LAEPAFEVFFAERQRVDLFHDALPALAFWSQRLPVVALSNGNADVHRVGIGQHFHASVSAQSLGVAKPDVRIFEAGAAAAGVPIERHAGAIALIEQQFGEAAYPKRVLMADFPQGVALIPNPVNRVPGFSLGHHHFFPGFPDMAWPMLDWVLATHYPDWRVEPEVELAIRVNGAGESQLLDLMERVVRDHPACKLFSLPSLKPERTIELGVRGQRADCEPAIAALQDGVTAAGFAWDRIADRG
jgi:molybdopterin-biosynthesis enzyme MoeA-like protein